jgi:hypothetical protein
LLGCHCGKGPLTRHGSRDWWRSSGS